MNDASGPPARIIACGLFALATLLSTAAGAEKILFDFEGDAGLTVEAREATVEFSEDRAGRSLRIATGHRQDWPGITLEAPDGRWDLSEFAHVAVDVTNVGTNPVEVSIRLDTPDLEGKRVWVTGKASLEPGEKKTLTVPLTRRLPSELVSKLFGMRGYPSGFVKEKGIDAANVDRLLVFVSFPTEDHTLEIDNLRAAGSYEATEWLTMSDDEFFPIIDRLGQFVHKSWPGKLQSADDFPRRKEDEAADLARRPGPEAWNQYGGWQAGPQLEATGHFRVEKHQGYWWLVDPEGRLFWSHGIDCVRSTTGYTPITDREILFADLPDRDSPFGEFYGRSSWAPHGYYHGKRYETYNFTGANLLRKYGPDWEAQFADLCHRRLRSWGMNTIANWSDPSVYLMRKTPYVATVSVGRKPLEGSAGYWGKFPDVFDPDFRESLVKRLAAEKGKTADDPWCIGYFVDNELAWGDELSLALATLSSPAEQEAKKVFLAELKTKYDLIEKLNEVWGTKHAPW
ncbi:MAG: beta-agarase, partial [Planctomycetes bacterium]|nr:beta-agarase [Planctomycetota bacterium]